MNGMLFMLNARRKRNCALMIALSFLCIGCLPINGSSQIPVTIPAAFSSNGEVPLPPHWWRSLADPDLDQLMERALAGNFSLKTARDRLDQAAAVAVKAGADRIPAINFETSGSRTWRDENGTRATTGNYSAGLFASYELDLWGRVRSGRDAADLDFRARAEDLKTAGITLSAQVAQTWYQWLEQLEQQSLYANQLHTNTRILELVTLQFRTGQAGIAEVLQQRQLVESARGELALVAARIKVFEHQLAILAGLAPGSGKLVAGTLPTGLPPLPTTGVPAEILLRRPDVRAAWLRLQAADQRIAVAVADRFPRIGLSGRVESSAGKVDLLFQDWLSTFAANLAGPLVDGGRRRAEVDRTRAVAEEALHDYGQTILEALGEVEDALVREEKQREHLASLERQLELADRSEASLRNRYLKGTADYQRVLSAQLSTQALQRKRLTALRELIGYRIALCRALAGGWEMGEGLSAER